jgi:hypothetical protein
MDENNCGLSKTHPGKRKCTIWLNVEVKKAVKLKKQLFKAL